MQAALDLSLHMQPCEERPWKYLPAVLVVAFAVRAAVALYGEFVLHPDEIMQYLEPAHRLVFGYGIRYWEYFYGARPWLVPGAIAGVLKAFDLIGLGQPFWYVGGVKLVLCAVSLVIPAAMYVFARRHYGESTARVALVACALWYELAGFAHKPMTEFVAAAPLLALLALGLRPSLDDNRAVWLAAFLSVLTVAVRMQYAPLSLLLLGVVFLRTRRKFTLVLAAAAFALAAGIFDAVAWDGVLFHSYLTNLRYNLFVRAFRGDESPVYQFVLWLSLASGGLSVLCILAAWCNPRRYGLVLALITVLLVIHSLEAHKEYRFVFVVVPLWILLGADLVVRLAGGDLRRFRITVPAAVVVAAASLAGILNWLPYQQWAYKAWSGEAPYHWFVRRQDPVFAAYRYLATAPDVKSVWHIGRQYLITPGYYYLHRRIPFYDLQSGRDVIPDAAALEATVSHIVADNPRASIPGYSLERAFGPLRILRRIDNDRPVRQWRGYSPIIVYEAERYVLPRIDPDGPVPPDQWAIRFTDPPPPPGGQKFRWDAPARPSGQPSPSRSRGSARP